MTLDPKIYRRAAIEIAEGRSVFFTPALNCYCEEPLQGMYYSAKMYEYIDVTDYNDLSDRQCKTARSLALLFMEQISKDLNDGNG